MIATSRQSASVAIVPTIREGFAHGRATYARLACAPRINLHYSPASILRFVGEHRDEHRPTGIVNGLRQHSSSEALHVQILDRDQPVLVDQITGNLVLEVAPLVANMNVGALEKHDGLTSSVAPLVLPPRDFPLSAPQPRLGVSIVPRVLNLAAICEHGKAIQTDIDSSDAVAGWKPQMFALDTEAHEPVPGIPLDCDRLDFAFDGPVQFDLYVPGSLHAQLAAVQQSASIAVGRKRDAVVTARGTVAREPGLLAALHAGEERLIRLIHSAQHILAAGEIRQRQATVGPHRLQLVGLVVVVDRLVADLPGSDPLLKGSVVEAGRVSEFPDEKSGLRLRRVDPVFEGEAQLFTLLPFDVLPHHGFTDGAHNCEYAPDRYLVQDLERVSGTGGTASLFRCRLNATVPEA